MFNLIIPDSEREERQIIPYSMYIITELIINPNRTRFAKVFIVAFQLEIEGELASSLPISVPHHHGLIEVRPG